MKTTGLITRRRAIITGLASVGGVLLARYPQDLPPTYGNLLRMGDTLTYAAHRALLPGQSLVTEYRQEDLTSFPATGTTNPGEEPDDLTSVTPIAGYTATRLLAGVCRSRAASPSHERSRSPS